MQVIKRLCQFLTVLSKRKGNAFDVILFDLDPSTSALNKFLIAYICDFLITPAQAGISSSFAVHTELKQHLPKWLAGVDKLGVRTRLNVAPQAAGVRDRLGYPRMLPAVITDFDLQRGAPDKCVLRVHANHMESLRLLMTTTWVARGSEPDPQNEAQKNARLLHSLYLPTADGEVVLALWPRVSSLAQAHEMGRALCALDRSSFLAFFKPDKPERAWEAVEKDITMVSERFRTYAKVMLKYGALLAKGQPIGNLMQQASA